MEILAILLIIIFTTLSAVTIWLNLPGSFIMLLFIFLWAWIEGFVLISLNEILIIFGIMIILEVMEFVLAGVAARYGGAEKRSAILAVIGGLVGTIILGSMFFIVGAIFGLFIGSYLGAYWGEKQAGKSAREARKASMGALLGSVAAKMIKSGITVIIGVWMMKEVV